MTVTWKNNVKDHVVEKTALPDHLIKGAQGRKVFDDNQLRVRKCWLFEIMYVLHSAKMFSDV